MAKTKRLQAFYKSKAWRVCRAAYLSEHPYCEYCAAKGLLTPAKEIHHKVWLTDANCGDPLVSLNPDNLVALCYMCHQEEHRLARQDLPEGLAFTKDGKIVPRTIEHVSELK